MSITALKPASSNAPEPATACDRIVMAAAEALASDDWERWGEHTITIRGAEIWTANGARYVGVWMSKAASPIQKTEASRPVGEYFWSIYQDFTERRRAEKLAQVEAAMKPVAPADHPQQVGWLTKIKRLFVGARQ